MIPESWERMAQIRAVLATHAPGDKCLDYCDGAWLVERIDELWDETMRLRVLAEARGPA